MDSHSLHIRYSRRLERSRRAEIAQPGDAARRIVIVRRGGTLRQTYGGEQNGTQSSQGAGHNLRWSRHERSFLHFGFHFEFRRRRKRSRAGYHVRCMQPMAGLPRFADSAIPRANAEKLHDSTAITQDQTRSEQRSMGSTRMERLVFRSAAAEAGAEALPLWEEIWPGPAVKLVCPHAARLAGGRLGVRVIFALEM